MSTQIVFAVPGDLSTATGGYTYDRRVIEELQSLGFAVTVVDLGGGFPRPSEATRRAALDKLAAVPAGTPIIVDGLALGVMPQIAQLRGRNPLIGLVHHPLALETGLAPSDVECFRKSERAALASMDRVIVTSPTIARVLIEGYGVAPGIIEIAPPGIDPVRCGLRGAARVGGTVSLLSVGIVVTRKGYDVLIAALASLSTLPWHLRIVGDLQRDPAEAARLEADITKRGLAPRVSLEGVVSAERLAELYAAADLFVLASRYEGYGMAFAQAIAHGVPIIGTTSGAIAQTVPAGTGILVPPDDITALASALHELICKEPERMRLAENARAAAKRLPTWQAAAAIFARTIVAAR